MKSAQKKNGSRGDKKWNQRRQKMESKETKNGIRDEKWNQRGQNEIREDYKYNQRQTQIEDKQKWNQRELKRPCVEFGVV